MIKTSPGSAKPWNTRLPGREAAGQQVVFMHNGARHTGVLIPAMAEDARAVPAWLVRRADGRTVAFPGGPWRPLPVLPQAAYRAPLQPGRDGRVFLQFC